VDSVELMAATEITTITAYVAILMNGKAKVNRFCRSRVGRQCLAEILRRNEMVCTWNQIAAIERE
jgi:hypothetical protein